MNEDQEMDALIATAFQTAGEPTAALEERLASLRRDHESRLTLASSKEQRMRHVTTIAVWVVVSLLAIGTVSAAFYKHIQGTLHQGGQPVGTYFHREDGKTEINIPDNSKVKKGDLDLKGRDGAPIRVFIDPGK
jgi:hypothetical protein